MRSRGESLTGVVVPSGARRWTIDGLVRGLGRDVVARLVFMWGGKRVVIPTVAQLMRYERNREVCRLLDDGLSYRDVARRVGLSPQRVQRIAVRERLAASRSDGRQQS